MRPFAALVATGRPPPFLTSVWLPSSWTLDLNEYVVYSGTGNRVTVSGLTVGQTYYAAVQEGTGSACAASYLLNTPVTVSAVVAAPLAGTSYQFYRGNLHAHSGYSDYSASNFKTRFEDALRVGYHVDSTIDKDNHYSVFGRSTRARLVLQVPALTKAAVSDRRNVLTPAAGGHRPDHRLQPRGDILARPPGGGAGECVPQPDRRPRLGAAGPAGARPVHPAPDAGRLPGRGTVAGALDLPSRVYVVTVSDGIYM